ncbi:MAG TPA: MFS transporter [Cytophagaceae bacterium]|jgi:MFS family permease
MLAANNTGSLKALDWVNFLITDVKDGVGIYLSVYLLTTHHWDPGKIGLVMALPGFIGILVQPPVGAWIDITRHKRLLILYASLIIALGCVAIVTWPRFFVVAGSQIITGIVQAVYSPAIAAITLGIVGHAYLSRRIGRNESFNHLGNMVAAIAAGVIGRFYSYEGIFYLAVVQCIAIAFAILMIKEKDIDHARARSSDVASNHKFNVRGVKALFSNRQILYFTLAMGLFHFSNASLLPLIGQKLGLQNVGNSSLYLSACIVIAQAVMVLVAWLVGKRAEFGRKNIFIISFLILPIRGILYIFIEDPVMITILQILDGISAGIFGVLSIVMMADLSKGTGHFNLLQGTVYSVIGLSIALSSTISGYIVNYRGYDAGFLFLAIAGVVASLFFIILVKETKTSRTMVEPDIISDSK